MSDGWLDPGKYERVEILGCTGPGTMFDSAWKFIGHTTESGPGSIDAVRNLFQSQPCYCPQFTIDPAGSQRRMQHIPWTWSGAALQGGGRCGVETNRWRCVQAEICDYSANAASWGDDVLWQIGDLLADLIRDGCPINLDNVPDYPGMTGVLAIEDSGYRLQGNDWRWFDGIGAHVLVPCNSHYDWFHTNAYRIAELAKENLAGGGYVFTPNPSSPVDIPAGSQGYLAEGAQGGIVAFLQQLLIGLGYDLGPFADDGVFGSATAAAVRSFQADHGLDADGVVGPLTKAAIAAAYGNGPGVPAPGAPPFPGRYLVEQDPMLDGDDVRQWQQKMSDRGWQLDVDGQYGPESASTCEQFQAEKGLSVDRVVGDITWAATWAAPVTQ